LKKVLYSLFIILIGNSAAAQVTGLNWIRSIGGSDVDQMRSNVILRNGNFVSVGYTQSANEIATGNHGLADCIVACSSNDGILLWKKIIGGSFNDGDMSVNVDTTIDGNIVVGITSGSNDGDFSGNHGSYDISFVKYTATGNLLWSKTYGGNGREILGQLKATPDGGFIAIASSTSSVSGNVTGTNHGTNTRDTWVLKLDVNGNISWEKLFGGSLNESAGIAEFGGTIALCNDGGYIFAINSQSVDGDLTGLLPTGTAIGADDIWFVKISSLGAIQWQKAIGGSSSDSGPHVYTTGNIIYLLFNSQSFDRDLASNIGGSDWALFKFTMTGTLLWKHQYGGFSDDFGNAITSVNGDQLTVVGTSYSGSAFAGIPIINYGQSAILVARLDTLNGNVKWLKSLGGSQVDHAFDIKITPANDLFIVGSSSSNNYDIPGNHGNFDGIMFKLDAGNNIRGTAFIDLNNNNVLDISDQKPNYINIQTSKNNAVVSESLTYNGAFNVEVDTGTFSTRAKLWNSNYYTSFPDSFLCSFNSVNQSCTNDIALHPVNNIKDLRVIAFPVGIAKPGFSTEYVLIGYNVGTQVIPSGTISFKKDARVSYTNFSITPNNTSADSVTWNFTNLKPFDSLKYVIRITAPPPPTIDNWDTLSFIARILPVNGDAYTADNTLLLKHIVVASHDPNAKLDLHGNIFPVSGVQNGDFINYVIQFQNDGSAEAFDVIVNDTLSNKLQANSLEVLAASHPFTFTLKNKIASWKFPNINLPDSNTNEPASHGYILFRIKPISSLNTGDKIINRAAIYFDFNPAVITAYDTLNIVTPVITILPIAPIIQPAGDTGFCSGNIILRSNIAGGNQWYKNSIPISGAIADTLIVNTIGNYTATVTQNGATSNFSLPARVVTGVLQVVPIVKLTGQVFTIINPVTGYAYTWQVLSGGNWNDIIPAVTGSSYTAGANSMYRVRAVNGLCTAFSNSVAAGARLPANNPYGIYLYPNPVTHTLVLDNINLFQKWESLKITNVLGQLVLPVFSIKNQTTVSLDVSSLKQGIYFMQLINSLNDFTEFKFIKL